MPNIYQLIDKEDIENLQQLISDDPNSLNLPEGTNELVPYDNSSNLFVDKEIVSPLIYAIQKNKEDAINCMLSHARYSNNGDLVSQADELINININQISMLIHDLHCLDAITEPVAKNLKSLKRILSKLTSHFKQNEITNLVWKIILCDNKDQISLITSQIDIDFKKILIVKMFGLNILHMAMLLGNEAVALWIIKQLTKNNINIITERIARNDNFSGFNALHLAANLDLGDCIREIAKIINDKTTFLKLLNTKPSDEESDCADYNVLLIASVSNSYNSFCTCLDLGADIYSTGSYKEWRTDKVENSNANVLVDAMCAIPDDRMLTRIIEDLKPRPKSEFSQFINFTLSKDSTSNLFALLKANKIDLLAQMIELGAKWKYVDTEIRMPSFEYDAITIYKANLLQMAILTGSLKIVKSIILQFNPQTIDKLMSEICMITKTAMLNITELFSLKYYCKTKRLKSSVFAEKAQWDKSYKEIKNQESYQSYIKLFNLTSEAREILDILIIADAPIQYEFTYLIQRKKNLSSKLIDDTIKSIYLTIQKIGYFEIPIDIAYKLTQFIYLALNFYSHFQLTNVAGSATQPFIVGKVNDIQTITNKTIIFYSKNTIGYKLAVLAFRAWRHNQIIREEDSLARDQQHCKELIDLILSVMRDKWLVIKPLFENAPQLFIKILQEKIAQTNLKKSEIIACLDKCCEEVLKITRSTLLLSYKEIPDKDKIFIKNFAQSVMKHFNEEKPTFRFWDRTKERNDLRHRIEEVAINFVQLLSELDEKSPKRKKLITDLAMSDFSITKITQIFEASLTEKVFVGHKRQTTQGDFEQLDCSYQYHDFKRQKK